MATKKPGALRRERRVRRSLKHLAGGRPRLSVFRSSQHIYAQVIDDQRGHTVASASSLEKELREMLTSGADKAAAAEVGRKLAERAKAAGVEKVVFDRGAYLYHGRVKALGEAAREGGLEF
jgi:large subunit ribosomal protein L18